MKKKYIMLDALGRLTVRLEPFKGGREYDIDLLTEEEKKWTEEQFKLSKASSYVIEKDIITVSRNLDSYVIVLKEWGVEVRHSNFGSGWHREKYYTLPIAINHICRHEKYKQQAKNMYNLAELFRKAGM